MPKKIATDDVTKAAKEVLGQVFSGAVEGFLGAVEDKAAEIGLRARETRRQLRKKRRPKVVVDAQRVDEDDDN